MIRRTSLPVWVFLFFINGFVLCAGFFLLLEQNINALRDTAQDQTEENLRTFAYALSPLVRQHAGGVDAFVKDIASRNPDFRITVIDENGKVTGDSDAADISVLENHGSRPEVRSALAGKDGKAVRRSTVSNSDVMYYAVPLEIDGRPYALRLSMPVNTSVYFSTNVRKTMEITGIAVLALILIVSFLVSAHIVHEIGELQRTAEKYRRGVLDYRPAVRSPRELQELGEAMSSMADELRKSISDITEKRDEFKAVFSGITEGLIVFDSSMNVLEYNRAAAVMFDAEKNGNKTLAGFVYTAGILELAQNAVKGKELPVDGVEAGVHTVAADRYLLTRCVSIGGGRWLLVCNDITHLKKLEEVRKDFVANVSHELKTPVTSIKGFTETLLEGAIDDTASSRHFLEIIDSQSSRLMNIIDDLLTLSRLEQESRLPDMLPEDITEAAREVCASFGSAAEKKQQHVTFSASGQGVRVLMNAGLFQQALSNIVDNSIKYCPAGAEIECSVGPADGPYVKIVVQDNGAGIPPQFRERIFERFFRVDKGRSRETGGTGLGLSITSHIIQIHGGTVCETGRTDGKSGARFVITMPVYDGTAVPEEKK